jgi:hypothetical protein
MACKTGVAASLGAASLPTLKGLVLPAVQQHDKPPDCTSACWVHSTASTPPPLQLPTPYSLLTVLLA